jgi:hypothetical protein
MLFPKLEKKKLLNVSRLFAVSAPKVQTENRRLMRKKTIDTLQMIKQSEKKPDDDLLETSGVNLPKVSQKSSILKREHPDKVSEPGYHKNYNENFLKILGHDAFSSHYEEQCQNFIKNKIKINTEKVQQNESNKKSAAKHRRNTSKKNVSSIFSAVEYQRPDIGSPDILANPLMPKRSESWTVQQTTSDNSENSTSLGVSQIDFEDSNCSIGDEQGIPDDESCNIGRGYGKKKSAADGKALIIIYYFYIEYNKNIKNI